MADTAIEARCGDAIARVDPLVSTPVDPEAWKDDVTRTALSGCQIGRAVPRTITTRWPSGVSELHLVDASGAAAGRQIHGFFQILWWVAHIAFHLPTTRCGADDDLEALIAGLDLDWDRAEPACLADVLGSDSPGNS